MKKFVVAYFNSFDGELKQTIISAEAAYFAALQVLGITPDTEYYIETITRYPTLESLENDYCPNTDSFISVIEIC